MRIINIVLLLLLSFVVVVLIIIGDVFSHKLHKYITIHT